MNPRAAHRFYYSGHLTPGDGSSVELSAEETHHLKRVLRLREGTFVDLFDASGASFTAQIEATQGERALLRVLSRIEHESEPIQRLNLAVAVLKRRAMDLMIEKISELGVDSLQPLISARSIAASGIEAYSDVPERWSRLAIAAAKQCGRNRPLSLLPPAPVEEWLQRTRPPAHTVFADPTPATRTLGSWLIERSSVKLPMWIAIGPEGGWSIEETEAFRVAGFQPVRLGDLTLRAETAAIAVAAACRLLVAE